MNLLEINSRFIEDHIEELIEIDDYVPISFKSYNAQEKRDDFLRSKQLLQTIYEMDELVRQKCNHSEDSVKAYNSVLIEWLGCHPEFEGIIYKDSFIDYNNMKSDNEFIEFIDLLYDIEVSSEKVKEVINKFEGIDDSILVKDDSNIKYPNFNKMGSYYDMFPNTLLADYLAYLV